MPLSGQQQQQLANSGVATASDSSRALTLLEMQEYFEENDFPYRDESNKYKKVAKFGQGNFGDVFKARDKNGNTKFVAMKQICIGNEKEGFPVKALQKICTLQLLKHENVLNLLELYRAQSTASIGNHSIFYLVYDFCELDLASLLSNKNVKFSVGEIKKVMEQLLNGLYYMHKNQIFQRDIKPANVLFTKRGELKLADFGLARAFSIPQNDAKNRNSNRVVSLWYRAPELLLGDRNCGSPMDMWAAGCIMAEMSTLTPIMKGTTEQEQLTLISQLCGSITTYVWPDVDELELYKNVDLPWNNKRSVIERLSPYVKDQYGCDLLDKLLTLDPKKRIDADTALNHDFFWSDPMPSDLSKMLSAFLKLDNLLHKGCQYVHQHI